MIWARKRGSEYGGGGFIFPILGFSGKISSGRPVCEDIIYYQVQVCRKNKMKRRTFGSYHHVLVLGPPRKRAALVGGVKPSSRPGAAAAAAGAATDALHDGIPRIFWPKYLRLLSTTELPGNYPVIYSVILESHVGFGTVQQVCRVQIRPRKTCPVRIMQIFLWLSLPLGSVS